jgi:hypothetical protein
MITIEVDLSNDDDITARYYPTKSPERNSFIVLTCWEDAEGRCAHLTLKKDDIDKTIDMLQTMRKEFV